MTHPGVRAAAVVGLPHERWGELVAAFIVVGEGPRPEPSHLVEHVKARKGDVYAPKVIEFVEVLPVTAVGKIDKKAIRQAYWKGHSRSVS